MLKFGLILSLSVVLAVSIITPSFADTGCRRDCEPPTLGVLYTGDKVVSNGLTINDKSFDVSEHTQTLPTTVIRTGQNTNIKLIVYENSGFQSIREVSLSIGKFNDDRHKNMISTITFSQPFTASLRQPLAQTSDVSQVTNVVDPSGLLQDVVVKATNIDQNRISIAISFKVQRPIDTSDIIVQTTDANRETGSNVFHDAIKASGKDMTQKPIPPAKPVPPSPLKQLHNKVSSNKVECRDGYEKITRNNGAVACVSTYTADLLRSMKQAS